MGKKNSRLLNKIYQKPLPVVLAGEKYGIDLKNIGKQSPLLWVWYLFKLVKLNFLLYFRPVPIKQVDVQFENGIFKVVDEKSMVKLWREGFFGKGVLSRSDPTWFERTKTRLNLRAESLKNLKQNVVKEDLTKARRLERLEFKKKRQELQDLVLKQRQGIITEDELKEMQVIDEYLLEYRKKDSVVINTVNGDNNDSMNKDVEMRVEDELIIDDNGFLVQLEYMQLQAVEAFFLKFALDLIAVIGKDEDSLSLRLLFEQCCRLYDINAVDSFTNSSNNSNSTIDANNKFIIHYIVYHYFRSKGWCVRSGIKFGCDFLLYKRGPPFSHAEYCILVMQDNELSVSFINDWTQMSGQARVIGGVKKNLVQIYVEPPTQDEFDKIYYYNEKDIDEGLRLKLLLSKYRVSELLYRRWNPSRTRD